MPISAFVWFIGWVFPVLDPKKKHQVKSEIGGSERDNHVCADRQIVVRGLTKQNSKNYDMY
jgi:hypothetical protein